MFLIRHIEKLLLALAIVGFGAYVWSSINRLGTLAEQCADAKGRALQLSSRVNRNDFPPPEKDPARYSGKVISQWSDVPPVDDLKEAHFYYLPPRRR